MIFCSFKDFSIHPQEWDLQNVNMMQRQICPMRISRNERESGKFSGQAGLKQLLFQKLEEPLVLLVICSAALAKPTIFGTLHIIFQVVTTDAVNRVQTPSIVNKLLIEAAPSAISSSPNLLEYTYRICTCLLNWNFFKIHQILSIFIVDQFI